MSMKLIKDFHVKYDLAYNGGPRLLPDDLQDFRVRFMKEELAEFIEADAEGNIVKAADALGDLMYVVLGTAYLMGLPMEGIFEMIHQANMTKVRATDPNASKRGSAYDVVKPVGFVPPEEKIRCLLDLAATDAQIRDLEIHRSRLLNSLNI